MPERSSKTKARFYDYRLIVGRRVDSGSNDPDVKVWSAEVIRPDEIQPIEDAWLDGPHTLADAKYGAEYFARKDAEGIGISIPSDAHPEWSEVDV